MNEAERETLYLQTADLLRVALTEKLQTRAQGEDLIKETSPMLQAANAETRTHESARYNIAVIGRTGVGKSELINYLFGKQVAESGIGKPVTRRGFHSTGLRDRRYSRYIVRLLGFGGRQLHGVDCRFAGRDA